MRALAHAGGSDASGTGSAKVERALVGEQPEAGAGDDAIAPSVISYSR